MIYLLDLNFTLVTNSTIKLSPFARQIAQEEYNAWLVEFLKGKRVFLLTARPEKYRDATLERIKAKTGLVIEQAFFNSYGMPPPQAKEQMLLQHILPNQKGPFYGIESNPGTRGMYASHGIDSATLAAFKLRPR